MLLKELDLYYECCLAQYQAHSHKSNTQNLQSIQLQIASGVSLSYRQEDEVKIFCKRKTPL